MNAEYYCVFCEEFVYSQDVAIKCYKCKEYKGLIPVSEAPTNEEDN
jgi:hypothetical protein